MHKVAEGIFIDLDDPGDLSQASPLLIEALNLPKPLVQVLSTLLLGWGQTNRRGELFGSGACFSLVFLENPSERPSRRTAGSHASGRQAEAPRGQSSSFGKIAGPITTDDFDPWMLP